MRGGICIAITNVGAYGSTLSSNYNTRPLASEILVKKWKIKLPEKDKKFLKSFS